MTLNAIRGHKNLLGPALADPPLYELPDKIAPRLHVVQTLAAVKLDAAPVSPWEATMALADRMLTQPDTAGKLPTDTVHKAEKATKDLEIRAQALQRAREVADLQLSSAIADSARELLAAIAAAAEPVWDDIERCRDALEGVDTASLSAILRSGEERRSAWVTLTDRAVIYQQLRFAASAIVWDDPVEWDKKGCHREFAEGLCRLIGPAWAGQPMADGGPAMPWPRGESEEAHRLLHMARQGARPHWVDPQAQDRAWQAAHSDQYDAAVTQQSRHGQVHAWGS